ncbi:MAG: type II secretion system minor pseudopilin GspK [Thiohalomonadales bacterium]
MVNIKRQRGVALLTVILIVTLITIATISMRAHQEIGIRRTVNELSHAQAVMYLRGTEYLAMSVLKEDLKKNKTDTLEEDWATVMPPFPVDGGSIGGILEDLSGKFNINNLVDIKGKKSPVDYKQFKNLLINLKLDVEIADAIVDWIDKDDTPGAGGAEEGYYLGKEKQAYRTPNQLISSITELLLVKGIDYKVYNKLKNFITVLPGRNAININTADKEILKMISPKLTDEDIDTIIKDREKNPYKDTGTFSKHVAFKSLSNKDRTDLIKGLDVKSSYFLLTSTAIIGELEISMKSILKRNNKGVTVIVRSLGGL